MSTAVDILEEREAEEAVHSLIIACMAYTMCPECGHVDAEVETLKNHPCQKCG